MKITRCKLSKKAQRRLLEFFTAEVTARTAADLLDIQPNTAALFYHKIRLVIDYHLSLEADELFDGEVELDESYFGGIWHIEAWRQGLYKSCWRYQDRNVDASHY